MDNDMKILRKALDDARKKAHKEIVEFVKVMNEGMAAGQVKLFAESLCMNLILDV